MKTKLIILLLVISCSSFAQDTTSITALGSSFTMVTGNVTNTYVNGTFEIVQYPDTNIVQFNRGAQFIIGGKKYWFYKLGGVVATSATAVKTWYNANMISTGGGGVTSVATGAGLTGGPITSTGTISLDPTSAVSVVATSNLTGTTGVQTLFTYSPAAGRYVVYVASTKTTGRNNSTTLTFNDKNGVSRSAQLYAFANIGDPTITNATMTGDFVEFFPFYFSTNGSANIVLTADFSGTQSIDATLIKLP